MCFRDECSRKIKKQYEAKIIYDLRKKFKLSIILEASKFPKSTYMYWQKRLDNQDPDKDIEEHIKTIYEEYNGRYGYRRITNTASENNN